MIDDLLEVSGFNRRPSAVMHVDLNCCFATIEQQANPKWRGQALVVAAYPTGGGCVLAPSFEAKKLGIKTGMRVREAKVLCPGIKVLTPDPAKYRFVHQKMMEIFCSYSPNVSPKSIDEAVIEFGCPSKMKEESGGSSFCTCYLCRNPRDLFEVGREIKGRIKSEVGEWLTASIGLGPNRFLAKTAASLKKPDGFEEINHQNISDRFGQIKLIDLCGINQAYERRLNLGGIFTSLDFLKADLSQLRSVFRSVNADYWYRRLRGFEVDDYDSPRRSIGHSYALPRPTLDLGALRPILYRLCEKTGRRLRLNGYQAQGLWLSVGFRQARGFNRGRKLNQPIYSSEDIFDRAFDLLRSLIGQGFLVSPIAILAVSVFRLVRTRRQQLNFWKDEIEKSQLTQALDEINDKFGESTIFPAELLGLNQKILDRIAFGGIRDLGYTS